MGKLGQEAYRTLVIGKLEALMKGKNRLTLVIDWTKIYLVLIICKHVYTHPPTFLGRLRLSDTSFLLIYQLWSRKCS